MKILITGANSALALKLSKAFTAYDVVLGDYGNVPTIKSDQYRLIAIGAKNEDTAAHQLLNCCLDNNVDVILPLHQFELTPVAKASVLFKEFNIDLLLPDIQIFNQFEGQFISSNIVILNKGEVVFSNLDKLDFSAFANLSGAFYVHQLAANIKLNLISIR